VSDDRQRAADGLADFFGEEPSSVVGDGDVRVHVFVDEPDEVDDEPTSFFATAGVCARPLAFSAGGVELVLAVTAELEPEDAAALARMLVALGAGILGTKEELAPGALIELGPLPVFEGMSHVLLTRWDDGDAGTLTAASPPVALLSVNALFADEADAVSGMSEEAALAWLDEHGVDVDDPFRDSALADDLGMGAALEALSGGASSFAIASAMEQLSRGVARYVQASVEAVPEHADEDAAGDEADGAKGGVPTPGTPKP